MDFTYISNFRYKTPIKLSTKATPNTQYNLNFYNNSWNSVFTIENKNHNLDKHSPFTYPSAEIHVISQAEVENRYSEKAGDVILRNTIASAQGSRIDLKDIQTVSHLDQNNNNQTINYVSKYSPGGETCCPPSTETGYAIRTGDLEYPYIVIMNRTSHLDENSDVILQENQALLKSLLDNLEFTL